MGIKTLTCAVAAAVLLAAGGCGGSAHRPVADINVVGDVQVDYPSQLAQGAACASPDGYTDIAVGSQVVVTDAHGTKVGLGTLGAGHIVGTTMPQRCDYPFAVNGVPGGGKLYGLQIANRNVITYTASQLSKRITITPQGS